VDQHRAQVQILAPARHGQRDSPIHHQRTGRDPHHQCARYRDRSKQPLHPLIQKEAGHTGEQQGVGKRSQDSRTVVAIGLLGIRRLLGQPQRKPGNEQCRKIRKVVNSVADKRHGTRERTAHQFGDHKSNGRHHGPEHHALPPSGSAR
jgi:hypothetical protein